MSRRSKSGRSAKTRPADRQTWHRNGKFRMPLTNTFYGLLTWWMYEANMKDLGHRLSARLVSTTSLDTWEGGRVIGISSREKNLENPLWQPSDQNCFQLISIWHRRSDYHKKNRVMARGRLQLWGNKKMPTWVLRYNHLVVMAVIKTDWRNI